MGTRGLMAFVVDGETKAGYVHFDSYPSGLGADVLEWLHEALNEQTGKALTQVRALKVVNDETEPTAEQIEALKRYANTNVSTKQLDEWYVLLRECQGEPSLTLEAGYMYGVSRVEPYRLGCGHEYFYVVDFDKHEFTASGYGRPLGNWKFDDLPTREAFIAKTEPEDED